MIYCPSCQTEVNTSVDTCPTCGWRFNTISGVQSSPIVRPAVRPKIQCEVDLATTVDRTGSSEKFQTGIPLTYEMIISQLEAKAREVKCWLSSHGDLDESQDFIIHTDAGTPTEAVEDIRKISYGGGGDPPEHHLDAIQELLNRVPWTDDPSRARGAILGFLTADSKPTKSGISATDLGKQIREKGILLYLVCQPTPTLTDLVSASGGLIFEISNNPDPEQMQRIGSELAVSIVATVASGATVPMTVPA